VSAHPLSRVEKTLKFYILRADSSWFDVDTLTVLTRCYKTLLPKEDYVNDVLSGVPDLYGS
jgi:hypothetical protein